MPQIEATEPDTSSVDHNGQPLGTDTSNVAVPANVPPPTVLEPSSNPNVLETISIIMDQPGGLDNQPSLSKRLQEATKPANLNAVKANTDWKTQSLPILDNLVCNVVHLSSGSISTDFTLRLPKYFPY